MVPETIRKMLAELKKESKGDEDYPYNSFELTSITGTAAKSGDKWSFTARGSGQKYELVPSDALKKLVEAGKSQVAVAGKVTDENGVLRLEISDAKEPAN